MKVKDVVCTCNACPSQWKSNGRGRKRIMMEKTHLLGKTVRNTVSGETGTVTSVQAWDLNGAPGVFVEVVRVDRRKQHPYMYRVWRIEDVEEVEG